MLSRIRSPDCFSATQAWSVQNLKMLAHSVTSIGHKDASLFRYLSTVALHIPIESLCYEDAASLLTAFARAEVSHTNETVSASKPVPIIGDAKIRRLPSPRLWSGCLRQFLPCFSSTAFAAKIWLPSHLVYDSRLMRNSLPHILSTASAARICPSSSRLYRVMSMRWSLPLFSSTPSAVKIRLP